MPRCFHALIAAEMFHPHAMNRAGHQGLFFERFDGNYNDQTLSAGGGPAFSGGSNGAGALNPVKGVYYNRNRFYSPTLGRFTTRDPNETALPILISLAMNALGIDLLSGQFNAESLFDGGMNLYEYESSSPVNTRDPLGLFDDFDDLIGDLKGQRVATLGYIQEGAGFMLMGVNTVVDFAGGLLGLDLLAAGRNVLSGNAGLWDYLELGLAVAGPLGKAVSSGWKAMKWGAKFFKSGKQTHRTVHLSHMILQKLCFAAGTLVVMADGSYKPIEQVCEKELVRCDYDPEANNGSEVSRVVAVFKSVAPCVVDACFTDGVSYFTITATPEHPFWAPGEQRFVPLASVQDNTRLAFEPGRELTLVSQTTRHEPTEVFNFEVAGAHTYYVGLDLGRTDLLLVHNDGKCDDAAKRLINRIVKELGLTPGQRRILHDEITKGNYPASEIWEIARQVKELYPNK